MPYSSVDKPSSYFNTLLYTGNGSTQSITGVGFKPDWIWIKNRSNALSHCITDAVRGTNLQLASNSTGADQSTTDGITSFNSDGFSLGAGTQQYSSNTNTHTYVAWNWLGANTTASNTSGSITSTVSANTTSGFSIVSYTGNGTNGATIGHGLGVSPKMVIVKCRSNASTDWAVYHASLTAGNMVFLNTTGASGTISGFDNGGVNPVSSTTFTIAQGGVSQNNVNTSTRTYIAYCFAEIKGYSKFGSYTGNGSTDGTFVYTGFKPAFVLAKNSSTANRQWYIIDNKRSTSDGNNVLNKTLAPNQSNDESWWGTNNYADFVSNGFKFRDSYDGFNESGGTYIYMAFASNPFVSSKGIPCTAR